MKTTMGLGLGALALAAVAFAASPLQDAGDDMAAMMEAWAKAATPGEAHAGFARSAGTWNALVKTPNPMDPSAEPTTSEGTSHVEVVLGGRYLVERFEGEMPGMGPFQGMGVLAFNNVTGEFEHVWMDSMGTGMLFSRGKENDDGSFTLKGEYVDAVSGQKVHCRMITRELGPDERSFEMYSDAFGPEQKMMEITYTRAAGS